MFDIVRDGAGRLQRELFVQSADVAPIVDPRSLFDSAEGWHCRPRMSAGGMRCVPPTEFGTANGTNQYSSDPQCRIEALPIGERPACSDILEDPDETCRTGAPRFFRVAGTSTRAYDLLDDCRPVTLPEPVTLFEPANLPRLTRVVHD